MKSLYQPQEHTIGHCICPDCYKLLQRSHVYPFGNFVGCKSCGSTNEHITVDEIVAQSIILLNKKGYKTKACCSGHVDGSEGYVAFYVDCDVDLTNLPRFTFRKRVDHSYSRPENEYVCQARVFRWCVEGKTMLDRLEDLLDKHRAIYEWVEQLENKYKLI